MKIDKRYNGMKLVNGTYFVEGDLISEENIEVELDSLLVISGCVISKKGIEVRCSIKADNYIEAGEHIKVGGCIEAGEYIKAGGNIEVGEHIEAGEYVEYVGSLEEGFGINAGWNIESGDGFEAGCDIEAGEDNQSREVIKMKQIKVEWCENFIRAQFTKHHAFSVKNAGIEVNCFWKKAEDSGLWERSTYGSPMSEALANLTKVETVLDVDGNFCYNVFRLAR